MFSPKISVMPGVLVWIGRVGLCVAMGVLGGCGGDDAGSGSGSGSGLSVSAPEAPKAPTLSAEDLKEHNHAIGLMEQFRYDDAAKVIEGLLEKYPDWVQGRVDHAVTLLNRRNPTDLIAATEELEGVLEDGPGNLRAHYCLGLILLNEERLLEAAGHFRVVVEGDATDAHAAYYMGETLAEMSRPAEALPYFDAAIRLNPYLGTAFYRRHFARGVLDKRVEGEDDYGMYSRLKNHPRGETAEFKYTRMGSKAELKPIELAEDDEMAKPEGPLFAGRSELRAEGIDPAALYAGREGGRSAGMTVADVNGDGVMDLFLPGATGSGDGAINAVLLGVAGDAGAFELAADHPLAGVTAVNTALWGDYDNDGLTDVFLCRRGVNQLWRQHPAGEWRDVTGDIGVEPADLDTVDGAFADADHDGDLDLILANADGTSRLLNNNHNGTFRDISEESGVAGVHNSYGVELGDLDGDRDADLVFLVRGGPHVVLMNELLWNYRAASGLDALRNEAGIVGLIAEDLDVDGRNELYSIGSGGVMQWVPSTAGVWESHVVAALRSGESTGGASALAASDVDGDGVVDLIFDDGRGLSVILDPLETATRVELDAAVPLGWASVLINPTRGPTLIAPQVGGLPVVFGPGEGRYPFLAIRFTGMYRNAIPEERKGEESSEEDTGIFVVEAGEEEAAPVSQLRSNASGIGVSAVARVGTAWAAFNTYRSQSGPGQSLQPVALGLGGRDQIDFLRVLWPDGLMQTALSLEAGQLHNLEVTILNEQRQLPESCPLIFVWDGQRYQFVTDFLGVGGIGFNIGRGEYVPARPWENVLLPKGLLQERDGRYVMKINEPMEEVTYLDRAALIAYDLPTGWDMTIDERFNVNSTEPTGNAIFYRQTLEPIEATDQDGREQTDAVRKVDGVASGPATLDRRFIGRAEPHSLTLRFEKPIREWIEAGEGSLVMLADGWVEYPYSQTMFAAWQAGAEYVAPTLEARGADGAWVMVADQFGYPAGMPRQMALPIDIKLLPEGATELRISSSIEAYWDRVRLIRSEPCAEAVRVEMPMRVAELRQTGFPRRSTGPQHRPHYDYSQLDPFIDMRHLPGYYTATGPVDELVGDTDSALAIFGAGDEVHLEFDSPGKPVEGFVRRLVLETTGWCKGMDLYTRDNRSLEPIPSRDGLTPEQLERRERLHDRYNTRMLAGPS